jgi:hypothetical protein
MNTPRGAIRILVAAFVIVSGIMGGSGCSTVENGGTAVAGEVKGNVQEIDQRAQAVFKDMNIQLVSTDNKDYGHDQSLGGRSGDEDVSVNLTSSGDNTTHVQVVAKTGTIQWDKDYAQKVLSRIVQG